MTHSQNATPLAVDLDGTLIADDVSVKTIGHLLRKNPFAIFPAVFWFLTGGRARLKREIARRVPLDPASLRYHPGVMEYLREERSRGGTLILATAPIRFMWTSSRPIWDFSTTLWEEVWLRADEALPKQ